MHNDFWNALSDRVWLGWLAISQLYHFQIRGHVLVALGTVVKKFHSTNRYEDASTCQYRPRGIHTSPRTGTIRESLESDP